MEEIWKDIPGFEGYYQASTKGRIRSLDRTVTRLNRWGQYIEQPIKGRILNQGVKPDGYCDVALCVEGVTNYKCVHRLIAETFIPNPEHLPQVNHKDQNPSNNNVDNLEWCTAKYNSNYGTRNERLSKSLKALPPRSEDWCKHLSEHSQGENNPMYGRNHSDNSRKKISDALKGRKQSAEHIENNRKAHLGKPAWNKGKTRPVTCLDANLQFNSSQEAANWVGGVDGPAIQYSAKHIACCNGHVFVYSDSIPDDVDAYVNECYRHSRNYKHLVNNWK